MLLFAEAEKQFEIGEDGKIRLKTKKIDLSKITADELKALGIDPNLSEKEIAKRLKVRHVGHSVFRTSYTPLCRRNLCTRCGGCRLRPQFSMLAVKINRVSLTYPNMYIS